MKSICYTDGVYDDTFIGYVDGIEATKISIINLPALVGKPKPEIVSFKLSKTSYQWLNAEQKSFLPKLFVEMYMDWVSRFDEPEFRELFFESVSEIFFRLLRHEIPKSVLMGEALPLSDLLSNSIKVVWPKFADDGLPIGLSTITPPVGRTQLIGFRVALPVSCRVNFLGFMLEVVQEVSGSPMRQINLDCAGTGEYYKRYGTHTFTLT